MHEMPSILPQLASTILFFGFMNGLALTFLLILAILEKRGSRASVAGGFLTWLTTRFRPICLTAAVFFGSGVLVSFVYLESPIIGFMYLVFTAIYAAGSIWNPATKSHSEFPSA